MLAIPERLSGYPEGEAGEGEGDGIGADGGPLALNCRTPIQW